MVSKVGGQDTSECASVAASLPHLTSAAEGAVSGRHKGDRSIAMTFGDRAAR